MLRVRARARDTRFGRGPLRVGSRLADGDRLKPRATLASATSHVPVTYSRSRSWCSSSALTPSHFRLLRERGPPNQAHTAPLTALPPFPFPLFPIFRSFSPAPFPSPIFSPSSPHLSSTQSFLYSRERGTSSRLLARKKYREEEKVLLEISKVEEEDYSDFEKR